LGGRVESTIHCDLVVEKPTVYIDGQPILAEGLWRLDPTTWQLDHHTLELPQSWWGERATVRRSGSRYGWEEGRLVRYWNSRSGQHNHLPVGNEETARSAGQLMRILHDQVDAVPVATLLELASNVHIPAAEVPALVWTLQRYDLVRIERSKTP
jgi:hypothetical protein